MSKDFFEEFEEKKDIIHNDLVFGDGKYTIQFIQQYIQEVLKKVTKTTDSEKMGDYAFLFTKGYNKAISEIQQLLKDKFKI